MACKLGVEIEHPGPARLAIRDKEPGAQPPHRRGRRRQRMPSKVPGRAGPEQVPNDLDEAGQNPAQRAAKPRQTASHTNRGPKMVLRLFRAMAALSPQKPTSMDAVPANIHSADYAFEVCAGSCRDGAACRPPGWATTGCGTLSGCGCTRSCRTLSTAAHTCGRS